MANKQLFNSSPTTTNAAGGAAFNLNGQQALAQYCATGTLGGTYYTDAKNELQTVLSLSANVPSSFIAACAVYSRKQAFLKDMPALLLAVLTARAKTEGLPQSMTGGSAYHLKRAWPFVIDNAKMLRNYAQIVRSNAAGRKSFGTMPKRLIQSWLNAREPGRLLNDSVGQSPSLVDVIKMAHPRPANEMQRATYGYLLGKPYQSEYLPDIIRQYEAFKSLRKDGVAAIELPDVEFRLLDSMSLLPDEWKNVARNASWHQTRMNLNTFGRHGVFEDPELVNLLAERLANKDQVKRAKAFPFQLLAAFKHAQDLPMQLVFALESAMEAAVSNIHVPGKCIIALDVSGSMSNPVTGHRFETKASKITCLDAASCFAATLYRNNPESMIIPFDTRVFLPKGEGMHRDTPIMKIVERLQTFQGGGTNCALPLIAANELQLSGIDSVIYVSDYESWVTEGFNFHHSTGMYEHWKSFRTRNPYAKLVCINVTPQLTVQTPPSPEILNIGGFNDSIFDVVRAFLEGVNADSFVEKIESNYRHLTDNAGKN